eukprot:9737075-Heterocapsa_arctica.AAC.1
MRGHLHRARHDHRARQVHLQPLLAQAGGRRRWQRTGSAFDERLPGRSTSRSPRCAAVWQSAT